MLLCHIVIAGLMVDVGEVMALGGRQMMLGRCQVVLRGWMLNGHIGPPVRHRPAARSPSPRIALPCPRRSTDQWSLPTW
jgi:hypothetical protein